MEKTVKEERIVLYNESGMYNTALQTENELFETYDSLLEIATSVMGVKAKDSMVEIIQDPTNFLIEKYWELGADKLFPIGTDKAVVFELLHVGKVLHLNELKNKFDIGMRTLQGNAPTLTKNGLKSNLKQSSFDKYLNNDKREEYTALLSFIKSAKRLEKYGASGTVNLLRYSNKLKFQGLDIVVNNSYFL